MNCFIKLRTLINKLWDGCHRGLLLPCRDRQAHDGFFCQHVVSDFLVYSDMFPPNYEALHFGLHCFSGLSVSVAQTRTADCLQEGVHINFSLYTRDHFRTPHTLKYEMLKWSFTNIYYFKTLMVSKSLQMSGYYSTASRFITFSSSEAQTSAENIWKYGWSYINWLDLISWGDMSRVKS